MLAQTQPDAIKMPSDSSIVIVPFIVSNHAGELRLALNVHKIVKVIENVDLDRLPSDLSPFMGVVNVDGIPVPVCDLKLVFNEAKTPAHERRTETKSSDARIIICNFQNVYVGIQVDRTRRLEQYPNNRLLPAPAILNSGSLGNIFSGLIQEDSGNIYLLNIEEILFRHEELDADGGRIGRDKQILAGKRILVVEDAPFFRKRSTQVLEREGAYVQSASDGQQGLELFMKNAATIDLVFTDIEMPNMSGLEMAAEIRKLAPQMPILFNSAISNPGLINEIKDKQLGDYILKFDEKTIVAHIQAALKIK